MPDPPTYLSDPGTGKIEHCAPHEMNDKMARWLEQTPQEEPWSAVGYHQMVTEK